MTKRIYTAKKMREMVAGLENNLKWGMERVVIASSELIEMLRQAAEFMEREEKRKEKYEYAVKYIGGYISDRARFETLDDAKMCRNNLAYDIVRRPVGEWEEVKNG